jgi:Ca2+-binding RTX toxin-like protein
VAGAGAETINASQATGKNVFFAGSGSDCIVGGSGDDLFVLGTGNATLTGGAGRNAYVAVAGAAPRAIVITDFDTTRNAVGLFGYGSTATAAALASVTLVAGSTNIALSDGTRITFQGVTALNNFNFF